VDEDEDGHWFYDENPNGGADDDDDDAPANPNLSTPPDADADPSEVFDAGAEDDEDNEEIAPRAFQHMTQEAQKCDVCIGTTVQTLTLLLFSGAATPGGGCVTSADFLVGCLL
jgi:hypothetical protein